MPRGLVNAAGGTVLRIVVIGLVVSAATAQYIVVRGSAAQSWSPQLICLFALAFLIVRWSRRDHGTATTPAGVCAITMAVLFGLRPVFVHATASTDAGAAVDARPLDHVLLLAGRQAIYQAVLFLAALGVAVLAASAVRGHTNTRPRATYVPGISVAAAGRCVTAAICLAALADLALLSKGGGISGYLSGVSNRSSFLAGSSFLTLAYVPLLVALVHYVLARRPGGARVHISMLEIVGTLVLAATTVLSGGRAQVLLGFILPLVLAKQYGPNRFKWWSLSLLGAGTVLLALVMGLLLRDNQFNGGSSLQELKASPLAVIEERISDGIEMRPFDSVLRLDEGFTRREIARQDGQTYLTIPSWFVPRALWPGKPYGGGNAWFTSSLEPRYYWPDRVETSLSAVGEAYANFWYPGVLAVGALTGLACALTDRLRRRSTTASLARCAVITPLFVSFIRGDAYHNGALALATLITCWAVAGLSRTAPSRPVHRVVTRQLTHA